MKAKLIPIQICLLCVTMLPVVVQAQFNFTTNADDTITITGYTGSNGVVAIPSTITDLPVTSLGDWAFYATGVTNVLIPDSVINIGDGTFFDCESLTNVTLGSSVTDIGDWAFGFSSSLMSINFRGNAPSLGGSNVFYGNAATIYYLSGATNWGPMFDNHPAVLWNPSVPFIYTTNSDGITLTITGYAGPGGAVTIPGGVNFLPATTIGFSAFYGCGNITGVTISDNIISIEDFAFADCTNLTNVTIPNSVINIGDGAFIYCANMTNISLNRVTSIGQLVFAYCTGLTSITIPDSIANIEDNTFLYCTSLTNVIIPISVTSIGDNAFEFCTGLISVTIPSSVTSIQSSAFEGCTKLTAIAVDQDSPFFSSASGVLFNLGQTLLLQCPEGKFGSYTIPNSVINIDGSAFYNCAQLTSVMIPDSVISIGDSAFDSCTGLTNVTIGSSVTDIGIYAFSDCTSLTSVSIPNSVNSISSYMFLSCSGLTNITIPNSVTIIGSSAFEGCTSLTGINIPDSISFIGSEAFYECINLASITIPSSVTMVDDSAFFHCESLTNVTIESSATSIGSQAFNYCIKLNRIFFYGDAPAFGGDGSVFDNDLDVTVYYLPGTTGWDTTFDYRPTAPWFLPNPTILNFESNFGVQTNNFGFTISWATNVSVVVEASTNLIDWQPVQTNTLTSGASYFSDSQWTNYSSRFYRLRSP
jgi:hypothetical protein